MRKKLLTLLVATLCLSSAQAQKELWIMEAESPESRLVWHNDTAEVWSPKGNTIWYKDELKGNTVIEYEAMIIEKDSTDRLSDLNTFWMATDPGAPAGSIWVNYDKREGVFKRCYNLRLYYVGYGGNSNSTTRFRRYDGVAGTQDGNGETRPQPAIIKEYTDAGHLLKPNHWYQIRLEAIDGRVRYTIDGETLVDYTDEEPLRRGWFGIRTTWSHMKFRLKRIESN